MFATKITEMSPAPTPVNKNLFLTPLWVLLFIFSPKNATFIQKGECGSSRHGGLPCEILRSSVHVNVGIAKEDLLTQQAESIQADQLLCNRKSCSTAIFMAELLGQSDTSAGVGDREWPAVGFEV